MDLNLFQIGNFTLASGKKSNFKIDCDALTYEDIETFAYLLSRCVSPFNKVEGVPLGGLRLAKAMEQYCIKDDFLPTLLVDDVWTTGKSMKEVRGERKVWGAVIFARGPLEDWVQALFDLHPLTWELG